MRTTLPAQLERGRERGGEWGSRATWGAYGRFIVQGPCGAELVIVASAGDPDDMQAGGWEHVSVSTRRRCPNWTEMNFVKDLFWESEECVVQVHPPRSAYVNNHEFVLHLWRHKTEPFPMPPPILVGVQSAGILQSEAEARALRKAHMSAE